MRIGFDFHNVLDAYPNHIANLMLRHQEYGDYVCVISAIGPRRVGTIQPLVDTYIHSVPAFEVVFKHPRDAPMLKTRKALDLNLDLFYDDRSDVVKTMNDSGILCFQVPRIVQMSDEQSDSTMK
jgi:acid phosphatase class B